MFSFIVIIFLMATVQPVARHHGGDGGGRDPNRPRQLPANTMRLVSFINIIGNSLLRQKQHLIFLLFFFFLQGLHPKLKKGNLVKQNKLNAMEDLRKQAEGGQLDIEFDEVEMYKAVGHRSANFNNAIGMITRDLLEPYFFCWKDQVPDQRRLFWPRIIGQFHSWDTPEHRASIERPSSVRQESL